MEDYDILVNRNNRLAAGYEPQDLVYLMQTYTEPGKKVYLRCKATKWAEHMFEFARSQGIYLSAVSGYRSYVRQQQIYEESVRIDGEEHARRYIAPPGGSEHQTGLALDVSCESEKYELEESFSDTPEGCWLRAHAAEFGYIIRYPKGKESITGYAWEPWHVRYVGRKLARELVRAGKTLEEWYG